MAEEGIVYFMFHFVLLRNAEIFRHPLCVSLCLNDVTQTGRAGNYLMARLRVITSLVCTCVHLFLTLTRELICTVGSSFQDSDIFKKKKLPDFCVKVSSCEPTVVEIFDLRVVSRTAARQAPDCISPATARWADEN